MALRRALVTAPLAVLVAIGAHLGGFGAEHALGGMASGGFVAIGIGGALMLGVAALAWVATSLRDIDAGERRLLSLLPARGGIPLATALAGYGFLALAAGEALEGRSPFGTWATTLALIVSATLVAFAARRFARWLAAGGILIATIVAGERRGPGQGPIAYAETICLASLSVFARGAHRGRAPPRFA